MIDGLSVLALIPARGGSKGVPKKNIKSLRNKPLIAYSIEAGLSCPYVDAVVVTTDSEEIAEVSKSYGAEVPFMRPAELAADKSKTIDCVIHAIGALHELGREYDLLILLQPTSPLRTSSDISNALDCFIGHGLLGLCSVSLIEENPLLIRIIGEGGVVHPLIAQSSTMRRQDLPKYYRVDGSIYINKVESLRKSTSLNDNPIGFVMPKGRSIDIDTFEDFIAADNALSAMDED